MAGYFDPYQFGPGSPVIPKKSCFRVPSRTHFCENGCGRIVSANKRTCLQCLADAVVRFSEARGQDVNDADAKAAILKRELD